MKNDFYSTPQAAQVLRLSRVEVFRRIKSGEIKANKVGRNYIISKDALLEAMGITVGSRRKQEIEQAVKEVVREYGETFRRLGQE